MRPNKLIVSAFGPYAERVEINLDKLGKSGIYLITGDTGAGKTTIFDAITYALFGEPSGSTRESSMFRSKYALPETPTEVELYFTCKDKEYYIKRNPEYDRPKSRGEGTTTEKANAELHLPDGRIITKHKEVNSAVVEIIGVDRNQFTQIAMIAQGDFQKLLLSPTDERKKIFQKLFKTQSYYILQEKLKSESGKLSSDYDAIKNSIEQYVQGIVCDEEGTMAQLVAIAKNGEMSTREISELLEKLISSDEAAEKNISDEKAKVQKSLDAVKLRITKGEEIISAKADFEKNELALSGETEKEKILKTKLEEEKEKLPKHTEITEKIAEIKALLPLYNELGEKENIFKNNKAFIDESTETFVKADGFIKELSDEIASYEEEMKTYENAGEEKIKLENDKSNLDESKEKLSKLKEGIDDILNQQSAYDEATKYYAQKYQSAEILDAEFKEKTRIYLEAQAGILADSLGSDMPCPVCGSLSHPKLASKPQNVPQKEEIDSLSDRLKKANDLVNEARTEAGRLKGALTEKTDSIQKDIISLLGDISLEDAKEIITSKSSQIDALLAELGQKLSSTNAKINRRTELSELLPKKNDRLDAMKEKLTKIKDEAKAKQIENDTIQKHIAELKEKLSYETKDEALSQIAKLTESADAIWKSYDDALKNFNDNKEKLASLKTAKEEILKRIGDGNIDDIESEKEKKFLLEEKIAELDTHAKKIHSRISANKISLDNILKKLDLIKTVEDKWIWVKSLSNTANGNLSGKEKVMLETYIQMTFFDRIINRANTRLMVMSGGQYELKRKTDAQNNRSQSGLELDVIDHYNGTERSVKTLSGGESFKASLSLALGLSDEIQSSAGGIRLDTMFVDEGFGSLDDESLSQAIRALSSLAEGDRLVGIISHVGELKEKIEKQIVVKKEKSFGSSVTIIS